MASNLEKYKGDLDKLIQSGRRLLLAMEYEINPQRVAAAYEKKNGKGSFSKAKSNIPSFRNEYQIWYSEASAVIKQILQDRLFDFVRYYEKPKGRKELSHGTYVIEDYLQGTISTDFNDTIIVGPDAAMPQFRQQLLIVESARGRFESSLFDIKQMMQADLFDSELDAARELVKHRFLRAAGAIAGVVLEKHLEQARNNHQIPVIKKSPTINDLNTALKEASVIDIAQWRFIQHLGDLRNLCDHSKKQEPTENNINDLISGVDKIIKTVT